MEKSARGNCKWININLQTTDIIPLFMILPDLYSFYPTESDKQTASTQRQ